MRRGIGGEQLVIGASRQGVITGREEGGGAIHQSDRDVGPVLALGGNPHGVIPPRTLREC